MERNQTPSNIRDNLWNLANDYDQIIRPLISEVDMLIARTRRQVEKGEEINEEVLYQVNVLAARRGEEPIAP